jgi:hypothetical protein
MTQYHADDAGAAQPGTEPEGKARTLAAAQHAEQGGGERQQPQKNLRLCRIDVPQRQGGKQREHLEKSTRNDGAPLGFEAARRTAGNAAR